MMACNKVEKKILLQRASYQSQWTWSRTGRVSIKDATLFSFVVWHLLNIIFITFVEYYIYEIYIKTIRLCYWHSEYGTCVCFQETGSRLPRPCLLRQ